MGRKRDTSISQKKTQPKGKKKEIEFNFAEIRNGLSQPLKKNLIDYFSNARQVFNQSKEELFLLNKRFDALEYGFKELFKKECFDFNKVQTEPFILSNRGTAHDQMKKEREKEKEGIEFVINEKYLVGLLEDEKKQEDSKDKSNNSNSNNDNKSVSSEESDINNAENQMTKKKRKRQSYQSQSKCNKSLTQKNNTIDKKDIKEYDANEDDEFFDKDSDSFNDSPHKGKDRQDKDNSNNPIKTLDPSQSSDFNQKLFDYKLFSNNQSQSNKNPPELKDSKPKIQNIDNSWINK